MVRWIDDPLTFDVLQAKQILPNCGTDILEVSNFTKCGAMFEGSLYNVEIIPSG